MCVHCEGEHPIVMEAETQSKRVKYLAISGGHLFTANDWTAHGPLIRLNYCPMCGRDLRGGANEDGSVTMPRDLAHMALCGAVRWYVGRGTVASREVADSIRELLPQLGAGTKAVMARDIRRELETHGATPGPIDDMAPRRVLLDAIEGEPC